MKKTQYISRNTSSGTTGDRVFYLSYYAQNKEIYLKQKYCND